MQGRSGSNYCKERGEGKSLSSLVANSRVPGVPRAKLVTGIFVL